MSSYTTDSQLFYGFVHTQHRKDTQHPPPLDSTQFDDYIPSHPLESQSLLKRLDSYKEDRVSKTALC